MDIERYVYFTDLGLAKTGLTPTFDELKKTSDGSDIAVPPTITEIGAGWYKYTPEIPDGEKWVGVIDGGAALTVSAERYVPIAVSYDDTVHRYEVYVTPFYNEGADTVQFMIFLLKDGITQTSVTSATVIVYDANHTELFDVTGASSTNGVFILTEASPGFTAGQNYYCVAEIELDSETYTSIETFISLD